MAAILALGSSLLWGTGDFLGGRASRRWRVFIVLAWSQISMLLLLWAAVGIGVATMGIEVPLRSVGIGILGGIAGTIALAAFYRALAIGPMSVVPPIASAGVALPVAVGLLSGDDAAPLKLVGMALAVCGVVLASIGEGSGDDDAIATRVSAQTLALCLLAAVGFGLIFVALDAASGDSASTALVATAGVRMGSCATILVALLVTRTSPWDGVGAAALGGFVVIGLFDTGANLTFSIATAYGDLALVAVLGSLYPAVTSALAHGFLGERLGRVQLVGVVLALAGVVVLASQ
jgi:drug/metabolite transporter (DMT)-like permease